MRTVDVESSAVGVDAARRMLQRSDAAHAPLFASAVGVSSVGWLFVICTLNWTLT